MMTVLKKSMLFNRREDKLVELPHPLSGNQENFLSSNQLSEYASDSNFTKKLVVQRLGDSLGIYFVLDGDFAISSPDKWTNVDGITDSNTDIKSVVGFLYRDQARIQSYLLPVRVAAVKEKVRRYLTLLFSNSGYPPQSVRPQLDRPQMLVGYSAAGKRVGVIGTSLGVLGSLLAGTPPTDVTIQESLQTLRKLQENDGGWATNDTEPISIIPSTTFALWALHKGGQDPGSEVILRGLDYLEKAQSESGGWALSRFAKRPSIFCTTRALQILKMYNRIGPATEKGVKWLSAAQNLDGGWGVYKIDDQELQESRSAHTAYTIETLVEFGENEDTINRGRGWLLKFSWTDVQESGTAVDAQGEQRDWWYVHKSAAWCINSLLLNQPENLLDQKIIEGLSETLFTLEDDTVAKLSESIEILERQQQNERVIPKIPLWDLHDSLFTLDKCLDSARTIDINIFFTDQLDFRPISNPYHVGKPIKERQLYIGREDVIKSIVLNFTTSVSAQNANIYGSRRTGKTSLLYYLKDELINYNFVPVLIDIQKYMTVDTSQLLFAFAREIFKAISSFSPNVDVRKPEQDEYKSAPELAFYSFLDDVEERLPNKRLLILIDEYEKLDALIDKGKVDYKIYDFIRSITLERDNIGLIFSGVKRIDAPKFSDRWRSFQGAIKPYSMGYLDEENTRRLITFPPEFYKQYIAYTQSAITYIAKLCGGHPYLCQQICNILVDYLNRENKRYYITKRDVENLLGIIIGITRSHFEYTLWEECTETQKLIIFAIADARKALPASEIVQKVKDSGVTDYLQDLVDKEILTSTIKDSDLLYDIRAELLKHWVLSNEGRLSRLQDTVAGKE